MLLLPWDEEPLFAWLPHDELEYEVLPPLPNEVVDADGVEPSASFPHTEETVLLLPAEELAVADEELL